MTMAQYYPPSGQVRVTHYKYLTCVSLVSYFPVHVALVFSTLDLDICTYNILSTLQMDSSGQGVPLFPPPPTNTPHSSLPDPLISLPNYVPVSSSHGQVVHQPPDHSPSPGPSSTPQQPVHSASGAVGGDPSNLGLRIQYLERLCVNLQKEKKAMEEEFGRQRKKFMDRMMQSDAELAVLKTTVEKFSCEVQDLSSQLLHKDEEVRLVRE